MSIETDSLLGDIVAERPKPNKLLWIEVSLLSNVFLSGFDGTITASTYTSIGNSFHASNTISWITASYLVTYTAFQPLYGSFSDVLGRRTCLLISTSLFGLGCLGCGLAPNVIIMDIMRAVTGIGGGGLITMATVINSDLIEPKRRGMYQALQNIFYGLGSILGASSGGSIADTIGWRWCFLSQIPVVAMGLGVGYLYIENQKDFDKRERRSIRESIDFSGSILLVLGLTFQLVVLSLGGNEVPWSHISIKIFGALSTLLLAIFIYVEKNTKAWPVMPLSVVTGAFPSLLVVMNIFIGMAAYAYLFVLPLYFQLILGDSASRAGFRLSIPSLCSPIGGIITGVLMSKYACLAELTSVALLLMVIGNLLVFRLEHASTVLSTVYLLPANLGQGMVFPATLFSFISSFAHDKQAIATSIVYLFRSIGTVYGVSASAAVVQNILSREIRKRISDSITAEHVISEIKKAVSNTYNFDEDTQKIILKSYDLAIHQSFTLSASCALIAFILSLVSFKFRPQNHGAAYVNK